MYAKIEMTAQEFLDKCTTAIKPALLLAELLRMEKAGVGFLHIMQHLSFYFSPSGDEAWLATLAEARAAIKHGSLALVGPRGSGKTQIAAELMADAVAGDDWKPMARTLDLSELSLELRATYSKDAETSEAQVLAGLRNARLLVLDDLQEDSGSGFAEQKISDLLGWRYKNSRPTVFVANTTINDLAKSLGKSVSSRMQQGSSGVILCDGESWRPTAMVWPAHADVLALLMPAKQPRQAEPPPQPGQFREILDVIRRANPKPAAVVEGEPSRIGDMLAGMADEPMADDGQVDEGGVE